MDTSIADMLHEMRWAWLHGERIAQRLEAEHSDDDIRAVFFGCKIFTVSLESVFDQRMIDSLKVRLGRLYLERPGDFPHLAFALKALLSDELWI